MSHCFLHSVCFYLFVYLSASARPYFSKNALEIVAESNHSGVMEDSQIAVDMLKSFNLIQDEQSYHDLFMSAYSLYQLKKRQATLHGVRFAGLLGPRHVVPIVVSEESAGGSKTHELILLYSDYSGAFHSQKSEIKGQRAELRTPDGHP